MIYIYCQRELGARCMSHMHMSIHSNARCGSSARWKEKRSRDARYALLGFGGPSTKVPPINDIQNKDPFVHIYIYICDTYITYIYHINVHILHIRLKTNMELSSIGLDVLIGHGILGGSMLVFQSMSTLDRMSLRSSVWEPNTMGMQHICQRKKVIDDQKNTWRSVGDNC